MKGRVKWFNQDIGFGFIESEEEQDHFVHVSNLVDQIQDGDEVEFEPEIGEKGPIALNVTSLSSQGEVVIKNKKPLVISISDIEKKTVQKKMLTHLESQGTILVTCLKGTSLGIPDLQKIERSKIVLEKVQTSFPNYNASPLDWPRPTRFHPTKPSHPFISYLCDGAITLSPKDMVVREEDHITALTEQVHNLIIENGKSGWTILGDETGQFSEFKGNVGEDGRTSTMIWVAIPPDSTPPILPLMFHATGKAGTKQEEAAFRNLVNHPEIMIFSFPFEEGKISSGSGKLGNDPHLSFWLDTLPLVLEHIANQNSSRTDVQIFVEQVKVLESGIEVIPPMILKLKTALNKREVWANLSFKEMWVLSKNPCEHPWIGYPDAIGHLYVNKKNRTKKSKEMLTSLRNRVIRVPFRQTSLNGPIGNALQDTARPLVFLTSLSELSPEDLRDYIQPFFQEAISESLAALSHGDWQNLLLHMDASSKSKRGQNATALIHGFVDINETVDIFSNDSDKFDFLLAMLGTSNHIGAIDQANRCKNLCQSLIDDGYSPALNRLKKFQNLSGGSKDNMFDFTHIRLFWLPEDLSDIDDETAHYLGAQAQSRALRSEGDDFEEAVLIESFLRLRTTDYDALNRRYTLHSELLMDEGNHDNARLNLEEDLPAKIQVDAASLREGFYLAALLKSCALSGVEKTAFVEYSKSVSASLNEHHPSQRIAYWCARWASEIDQATSPVVEQCCNHLIGLMEIPLFTHDAAGVILACELLDMQSRGLIGVDAESFMESVLSNSAETTRAWVAAHPPNAEDWMAPLNFNYR